MFSAIMTLDLDALHDVMTEGADASLFEAHGKRFATVHGRDQR